MSFFSVPSAESLSITALLLTKLTLILLVAWGLHGILRRSNPRWRILVWRATAVALLAVSLLNLSAPLLSLPLLPALPTKVVTTTQQPTVANDIPHRAQTSSTTAKPAVMNQPNPHTLKDSTATPSKALQEAFLAAKDTELKVPQQPDRTPQRPFVQISWNLAYAVGMLWAIGVLLGFARLLVGVIHLAKIVRDSRAAPRWIESELARLLTGTPQVRVKGLTVRQSQFISTPCSMGLSSKTILLPNAICAEGSAAELRAVLAHELAHFAGNDLHWNYGFQLLSLMLWFHPLAWRMRLAHADACDQRCDADAASCLSDTQRYAQLLAQIALQLTNKTPSSALPMARSASVMQRIRTLHKGIGMPRLPRWKASLGLCAAVGVSLCIAMTGVSRSIAQPVAKNQAVGNDQTEGAAVEKNTDSKPAFSGQVLDTTGAPVTDARIELIGKKHYEAQLDGEGYYSIAAIEQEDTYRVRIISQKWVGLTRWNQLPQVQLTPTSTMVRNFELQRACTIRIRTVNEAGQPVPNVSIYSASLADNRSGNTDGVRTDKSGWATIGGLQPSSTDYIFGTSSKNHAFAKLVRTLDDPDARYEDTITLVDGVEVSGTVICSDNQPAVGWRILAMPEWWHFGVSPSGIKIAEDGSFTLSHISPGNYDVTVSVPTGEGMFRQERALSDITLPVAAGSLDIRLQIPSPQSMVAITGKIITSGGPRKATISIFARSENGTHSGSGSVAPGEQEFRISPLPPGRYSVTFSSTEIEQKRISGVEAPRDNLHVELQVTGKPQLTGKVIHADNKEPLTQFKIRVLKVGHLRGPNYVQDSQWQTIENPQGQFAVDVVGPGIYQVVATARDYAPTRSAPINTDEYQGEPLSLELSHGVSLSGMVVDQQGEPVDGATVVPLSNSLQAIRNAQGKPVKQDNRVKTIQGQFTLQHLAPGTEVFEVTHPEYCFALSDEIKIGDSDIQLEPIVVTRGGTVEGHVYDASGQPAPNITLYFQDRSGYGGTGDREAGRFATVVTDQAGYYRAQHLPEQLCYVHRAEEWSDLGVVRSAILPVNGKQQRLDFGGKKEIAGRLLANGKPLSNVKVQLGGDNPNFGLFKAFAQTNTNGDFAFWQPAHGNRVLYYRAPEGRNSWIRASEVAIDAGTQGFGEIDVRLVSLTVSVAGLSKDQAAESRVALIEYDPVWPHGNDVGILESRRDSQEPFIFRRVPPGTYELICQRADKLTLRKVVQIDAGNLEQKASIEWPTETGTLTVRLDESICGPGGCNPPNLWSADQRIKGHLYARDGNEIRLENIPAGKYYLADKDTRNAPRVMEFAVEPSAIKSLSLTPASYAPKPFEMGMLSVRCFTEEGVPLTGCEVTFEDPTDIYQSSAQYGRQTLLGTPGSYTMFVSFPGYESVQRQVRLQKVSPDGRADGDSEVEVRMVEKR